VGRASVEKVSSQMERFTSCSLLEWYQHVREAYCLSLWLRRKPGGFCETFAPSTKLHGVTFNNLVVFIFASVSKSAYHICMCEAVAYYAIITGNSSLTHVSLHATKVCKVYCKVSAVITPLIFQTGTLSSRVSSSHVYRIIPGWQPQSTLDRRLGPQQTWTFVEKSFAAAGI